MAKRLVLGDEHDAGLRQRLLDALKAAGATFVFPEWTLAGSQERATLTVRLQGVTLLIEAETYLGLAITGSDELVDEIAGLMNVRACAERPQQLG